MCGSLKVLGEVQKIGRPIIVIRQDGNKIEGVWDGFAKEETLESWLSRDWSPCDIKAEAYTERGRIYDIPSGYVLRGIVRTFGQRSIVKVITREPWGLETGVNNRWVDIVRRRY